MTDGSRAGSSAVIGALRAVLDERTAGDAGIERRVRAGSVEYLVSGRPFALAQDDALSFRLGPQVARAAAGTAGAFASPRGADWVRFAPTELDRFALDRAAAWFDHARRTVLQPATN